jgi:hypothetical protein
MRVHLILACGRMAYFLVFILFFLSIFEERSWTFKKAFWRARRAFWLALALFFLALFLI